MSAFKGKRWYFFPAVAVGFVVLVLVVKLRSHPPLELQAEPSKLVEVISLEKSPVVVQVDAFGRVSPKIQWQLLPEVGGRVVYKHPDLAVGKILAKDTLLLAIDPLDYQIRLAQAQADRKALEGQIEGKKLQLENLKLSLEIENNRYDLVKSDLKRKETLRKQNLISQSELDGERQNLLAQQQKLQELDNSLNLMPNETQILQAQLLQAIAREQEAQSQLTKTEIRLPFEGRVAEVNVEGSQVVSPQQVLARINGIEVMEVEAQVSLGDVMTLMKTVNRPQGQDKQLPRAEALGLTAEITLKGATYSFSWPAEITRIGETVDPTLATVNIVLQVEQQYRELKIGQSPPLVNGMFVSARIKGGERDYWMVPERALHGEKLYIKDQDNRLELVDVQVLFRQEGQAAVQGNLVEGMQLVLTDLIPAVNGMALRIRADDATGADLSTEQAAGEMLP
ncbi:efflux RND transporter periplasmic adaptor subunit [Shewanella pealeana]|uniref:Efflux transporter, RND family, MFP subunit n=1 Tax=Shewanella pealeana (strain ATCC 700345 / ANG-SQ1) TaxID=398579 RepID=A8H2V0_SHEPA|nr:HlyD family efflux transporter periplasmic adaptor subunit [Shewanella pealeana]ABV86887.1 efflux transporter, RND family, MFP subunit [Shewanella pealeana ATCC 700345]